MMEVFDYFKKDWILTGKHARYVDEMWEQNKIQKSFFKRLVDLYLVATVIGLRVNRIAENDNSDTNKRTVQVSQLVTVDRELRRIMEMVLLLDERDGLSVEDRIDRAFKKPREKEELDKRMELFNSYARGGIEVLHELLIDRPLSIDDDYNDRRIGNIVALLNNELIESL